VTRTGAFWTTTSVCCGKHGERHGGVEVHSEGDAFFVAFADPTQALKAAVAGQRWPPLAEHQWPSGCEVRLRMGVHSGSPRVRDGDYWGIDVNYAARLCAAANGGRVLVSQSTAGLVNVVLEDLGEHAVKDFPSARRIFHLPIDGRGSDQFPSPRTLRAGQTNLPDQLSSFIGREAELAELRSLMARTRLVTLTGAGGVGKTRLAVRLGAELLDGSGDGVWFVDLAPLSSAGLVASRAAEALAVTLSPDRGALEALANALSDRSLLVVLDNCEHVVEEAASLVAELLGRCPGVFVLATSLSMRRGTQPSAVGSAAWQASKDRLGGPSSCSSWHETWASVTPGGRQAKAARGAARPQRRPGRRDGGWIVLLRDPPGREGHRGGSAKTLRIGTVQAQEVATDYRSTGQHPTHTARFRSQRHSRRVDEL